MTKPNKPDLAGAVSKGEGAGNFPNSLLASLMSNPLLVFDLDGTLVETAPDLVATLNIILQRVGATPVPYQRARALVGGGAKAMIERGLAYSGAPPLAPAEMEEMFDAFLAHYEAHIADSSEIFPGVVAALDRFAAAGWHFAVCTNKIEHSSILLLQKLGIAQRFRAICGKNTFPVSKPDGDALIMTIARAGGSPQRAVMVGDSRTDIETARNAKIPVVAVDFGYTEEPIATFVPDRIISHFDALWDAVAALRVTA
jgi:phosphoglycolate phosphatase